MRKVKLLRALRPAPQSGVAMRKVKLLRALRPAPQSGVAMCKVKLLRALRPAPRSGVAMRQEKRTLSLLITIEISGQRDGPEVVFLYGRKCRRMRAAMPRRLYFWAPG